MPRTTDESRKAGALRLYHDEHLTAAEAAARVGVHERTVRRWLDGAARPPGPQPSPRDYWQPAMDRATSGPAPIPASAPLRLGELPRWLLMQTAPDIITGCMVWCGRTDPDGYGRVGGKLLHREVWQHFNGPLVPEQTLDHRSDVCRSHACWAPWHLQVVTDLENRRREGRPKPRGRFAPPPGTVPAAVV